MIAIEEDEVKLSCQIASRFIAVFLDKSDTTLELGIPNHLARDQFAPTDTEASFDERIDGEKDPVFRELLGDEASCHTLMDADFYSTAVQRLRANGATRATGPSASV